MTTDTNSTGTGQDPNTAGDQTNADASGVGATGAPAAAPAPATEPAAAPKPGENTDPATQVPDKYEFTVPEGMELDTAAVGQFEAIAKELKLPQATAQKLVDLHAQTVKAQAEAHARTVSEWADAVKTDKDIGGDKLAENLAAGRKVLDTFGTPALRTYLDATGLGNHPELVRLMAKIGKGLSEDTFVKGGNASSATDPASVMFPSMAKT